MLRSQPHYGRPLRHLDDGCHSGVVETFVKNLLAFTIKFIVDLTAISLLGSNSISQGQKTPNYGMTWELTEY